LLDQAKNRSSAADLDIVAVGAKAQHFANAI
jgi:hypothetical protein